MSRIPFLGHFYGCFPILRYYSLLFSSAAELFCLILGFLVNFLASSILEFIPFICHCVRNYIWEQEKQVKKSNPFIGPFHNSLHHQCAKFWRLTCPALKLIELLAQYKGVWFIFMFIFFSLYPKTWSRWHPQRAELIELPIVLVSILFLWGKHKDIIL